MRSVRQWMGETAGGLPATFWYLWTTTLINRVGSFVVILLAIYLTTERGFSPSFAGFVIGLWGAGGAMGTLVGGVLADRWGRRPTYLTALYGSACMILLLGFARGKVEIAATVLLLGVVAEAARPAMSALMVDIVAEKDRLRAFSLIYWVINVGFAVAATTAGLVAGIDYTLLFVIDAATTVAAATLVAIKVPEPAHPTAPAIAAGPAPRRPAPGRSRGGRTRTPGPGLRAVFADRVFMGFVGANVLTALVFMQHISSLPIAMSRDGHPASTFGAVIALNGILIVVGQLFIPRLLGGLSRSRALALAALIIGAGFGFNALADAAWLYAVAVLVWTCGEMLNSPSNAATNADLSPAHMRGRYQGVFSLSWSIAAFVAPIVGAAVLQYAGDAALWLGCFGVTAIVAAIHLLSGPARERRAAALAVPGFLPADASLPGTAPSSPVTLRERPATPVA